MIVKEDTTWARDVGSVAGTGGAGLDFRDAAVSGS